jgi:hypothetical protein
MKFRAFQSQRPKKCVFLKLYLVFQKWTKKMSKIENPKYFLEKLVGQYNI